MSRFLSSSLLGAALLLGATRAPAADPDAAPPSSQDHLKVIGLPEAEWSFTVDTGTMAANSLKGQWGNLTEAEQKQFTGLMAQLIYYSYQRFKGLVATQGITLAAEEKRPDGWFVRKFTCQPRDPKDLPLDFALVFSRDERGQCELKDWIQDGVDTVTVYRSQFLKILRNEGFPVLLEKMRAKIKKDAAAQAAPAG